MHPHQPHTIPYHTPTTLHHHAILPCCRTTPRHTPLFHQRTVVMHPHQPHTIPYHTIPHPTTLPARRPTPHRTAPHPTSTPLRTTLHPTTTPHHPPRRTSQHGEHRGFPEWKERAIAGEAEAQNYLGIHYSEGRGIDVDYEKAMIWYVLIYIGLGPVCRAVIYSIRGLRESDDLIRIHI